jgi:VanZ family protein
MEPIMRFLKKYFARLYIAIAWTLIVLVLLSLPGNLLPDEAAFRIPNLDKLVHICLFGGFVFLWGLYVNSKKFKPKKNLQIFFILFIIASLLGIGMEYVQKYFIPFREFELGDIIADLIGSGIAYGICNLSLVEEKDAQK